MNYLRDYGYTHQDQADRTLALELDPHRPIGIAKDRYGSHVTASIYDPKLKEMFLTSLLTRQKTDELQQPIVQSVFAAQHTNTPYPVVFVGKIDLTETGVDPASQQPVVCLKGKIVWGKSLTKEIQLMDIITASGRPRR